MKKIGSKGGIAINSILKKAVIHLRTWVKLLVLLIVGLLIIGFFVFVVYQPMYLVTLNGEEIGYTEDKRELQDKINEYRQSGDGNLVAFLEIDELPEYEMCLLKKGLEANDDEIFDTVISSGTAYYKYYAILENSEEKYYVKTFEEADSIVNSLKEQDSKNQDDITYIPKYDTELKEFSDTATVVAALYVEKPKVTVASAGSVNTKKQVDYSYTSLGITLIQPVSGTISSRFGSRASGTHTGLDIATSKGTPILAAASGTVIFAGYQGSYGYLVVIAHTDSVQTYYAHCSKLYVTVGQNVEQGETIAAVGSTGNSTGPHLHLEVRVNGVAKNPQNYLYN